MKNKMLKVAVFSLLTAAIAVAPMQTLAQETGKKPAAEKKAGGKSDRGPFHGKLAALDKQAKTITVGKRTFQITSETKLNKAGKPATLEDGVVGEIASGYFVKSADGKLMAKTVNFGPKPKGEAQGAGKKKKKAE